MPPFKTQPIANFKKQVAKNVSEADIQSDIENALRLHGYEVLSTSEHRRAEKCPHCEKFHTPTQGRGCTPGVPDLLVTHDDFPELVFLGLEVKGPTTPITPKQQQLASAGRTVIVYSAKQALDVVKRAHAKFKANRCWE